MRIWSVNTNQSDLDDFGAELFLNQNRVVLWWREQFNATDLSILKTGDLILAYHNKRRIIGIGFALSEKKVPPACLDKEGKAMEEFVDIDWIFKGLNNPINLTDIELENSRVKMFNGSIFDWTENIDSFKLLAEIGKHKVNI